MTHNPEPEDEKAAPEVRGGDRPEDFIGSGGFGQLGWEGNALKADALDGNEDFEEEQ